MSLITSDQTEIVTLVNDDTFLVKALAIRGEDGLNATPGSPPTSVQFEDGGTFKGDATFLFDKTTKLLAADKLTLNATGNNATNTTPLLVGGSSGQSVPLTRWKNFTGTSVALVNHLGAAAFTGLTVNSNYTLDPSAGTVGQVQINNGAGAALWGNVSSILPGNVAYTDVANVFSLGQTIAKSGVPNASTLFTVKANSVDKVTIDDFGNIVTVGNVTAATFSGSGVSLTSLNASNVGSGILGIPYGGLGTVTTSGHTSEFLQWNGSAYVLAAPAGGVSSVFGRTGTVTATSGDYTAAQVTNALDLSTTRTANTFLGGPSSGSAAAPTFRSLVTADLPAGTGTVTSVSASVPSFLSVSGSPVTTTGTLAISLVSQTQNLFFASPNGSSGNPTFRAMTTADLPSGTGTVTSVAATVPSFLSISGSPITTSGTLAITLANESANTLFAGPSSGSAAAPTFRAMVNADYTTTVKNFDAINSCNSSGHTFPVIITFGLAGGTPATTGTNKTFAAIVPRAGTITKAFIYAKTGPTTSALICDVNNNGTTIWATQGNRIQIAAGSQSGTQTSFDTTTVAEGDIITIDIDQIGSGTAGQDITVELLILTKNA